ncbi:MAG: hypothetical protein KH135_05330 [Firmicutes bacterium]|nr:hypothetical protein [Bacillota bacterium]
MIATTLGIVLVAALCIFVYNQQSGLIKVDFKEYLKLNESESRKLIYVGDNGIVSQELTPVLKEILVKNHKQAYFFEHKGLNSDEQLKFVKSNSVTSKEDGYILPFIIVVENKKVVASYEGYLDRESLETFLKKNDYMK